MKERALLVGIKRPKMTNSQMEASLAELIRLVDTVGCDVANIVRQELKLITPATFIGSGKVEEIKQMAEELSVDLVIFDDELSPAQNKNLADSLGVKVLDRTAVILDIFAKRARTREGELQVELAQLSYRLSRLSGRGISMMQQAGYIGNRGPGETKLEIDQRRVRERISHLRKKLKEVRQQRELHRRKREQVPIPIVSLVGYTNAGKSTLMNALTEAKVFVEDRLFATLDPTVRKMRLKSGREILIADTVGFIRKLPHQLVEAFRATFEEVERSDLLLHVVDISEPEAENQIDVVDEVLADMEMTSKPQIVVFNKCDMPHRYVFETGGGVEISAKTGEGLATLAEKIEELLSRGFKHTKLSLPHDAGAILSELYRVGRVRRVIHKGDSVIVSADLPEKLAGRYRKYCV